MLTLPRHGTLIYIFYWRRNKPSILSGNHHMSILFRHGMRRHVAEPIERIVNLSAQEVCEFH